MFEARLSPVFETSQENLFSSVYDEYFKKVYARCLHFTKNKDEAEDLTQEIMMKVYSHLAEFKGQSTFSTWLFSVTNNYCIDFFRKKKTNDNRSKKFVFSFEETVDFLNTEEYEELMATKFTTLEEVMNAVSETDKKLLLMKYSEGMSIQSIASSLGVKEDVVKMRIKRAKDRAFVLFQKQMLHIG